MSARTSILVWSAGSGLLLGLIIDAALIGVWALVSSAVPGMSVREWPKWALGLAALLLASIPIAAGVLGYLEGRLKLN
jgi:hypothetical protein